jgi:alkaline phosphatase D
MPSLLLTVVVVALAAWPSTATERPPQAEIASVGFASCNMHEWNQSYWARLADSIARHGDPKRTTDGFVWLGDVVYADRSAHIRGLWVSSTAEGIERKLQGFKHSPDYGEFLATRVAKDTSGKPYVTGTWDDHDMGKNDAGKEFELREASQQLYLNFFDVPQDSPRRQRRGVYGLQGFPLHRERLPKTLPAGDASVAALADFAVCALLLDARFDRDAPGSDGDMLGEEQWLWLEKTIADPSKELGAYAATSTTTGAAPAAGGTRRLWDRCLFTVIGSGVQVLGDEKPTEHWGDFPTSRKRFFTLLHKSRAERFAIISGDVHYSDLLVEPAENVTNPFGLPLVEVTTSGLTHAVGDMCPNALFDYMCFTPRRVARHLARNLGRVAVGIDASGDALMVNLTIHDLSNGSAVIEFSRRLDAFAFKDPKDAPCGERCALPVHSGRLKSVLFGFRQLVAPQLSTHRLLLGAIILTLLTVVTIVTVITCCVCRTVRRRLAWGGRGNHKPPKQD